MGVSEDAFALLVPSKEMNALEVHPKEWEFWSDLVVLLTQLRVLPVLPFLVDLEVEKREGQELDLSEAAALLVCHDFEGASDGKYSGFGVEAGLQIY